MADLAAYGGYEALKVTRRDHGVLDIVMSGEGANRSGLATANARMHREPPTSGATSTAIPTRASRSFAAKARASRRAATSRSSRTWRTTSTCAPACGARRATSSTT